MLANRKALQRFLATQTDPSLDDLRRRSAQPEGTIALYQHTLECIEALIWQPPFTANLVDEYQAISREMQQHLTNDKLLKQHKFIIAIPVADRPQHLTSILGSLLKLCTLFEYGGRNDSGQYHKVHVIIADDSKQRNHIESNKALANLYSSLGLSTEYFGISEQLAQLDQLDNTAALATQRILGNNPADAFSHKGPSITRNITYLRLMELSNSAEPTLFYFVDSDQEFCVKGLTDKGDQVLYSINYFHYLDRIFSTTDTEILTGKVVGDPPVSPAVMTGNFQDDVLSFLNQIARHDPHSECGFHGQQTVPKDDASYHDMANMFGFQSSETAYDYRCTLSGKHDHRACFTDFASKLSHFFDGEHPTRITYYQYENVMTSLKPARTIYTGNYIFKPCALKHFIPFATLRLRMAGPVLGRLIQAEIGPRFQSANLPMLHKRTIASTGRAEFRPGVHKTLTQVDLSGEFERQFFGDVMLFTVIALSQSGYPKTTFDTDFVHQTLHANHTKLLKIYHQKQGRILEKLTLLSELISTNKHWWTNTHDTSLAQQHFRLFTHNIKANFGLNAKGYALIQHSENSARRMKDILEAILELSADQSAWQRLISQSPKSNTLG